MTGAPIPNTPPETDSCADSIPTDPPPPYPSRERRSARTTRSAHARRHPRSDPHHHTPGQQTQHHLRISDSHTEDGTDGYATTTTTTTTSTTDADLEVTESTPFLGHAAPQSPTRRVSVVGGVRPRSGSLSHASTLSAAPSLAQTVFSLFRTEEDDGDLSGSSEGEFEPERLVLSPGGGGGVRGERRTRGRIQLREDEDDGDYHYHYNHHELFLPRRSRHSGGGFFSIASWRRYFRPLTQKIYYRSLFHLTVLNFPYALAAWVYLFVLTLTGTTLLMALPLGALLCFFNLLGARTFARGELALQTRFHSPLGYPPPYPPRPIFTRLREPTSAELEAGASGGEMVPETSFYKNAYAMFTDPTSYHALFYFLVIKPCITLLLSLSLIVFVLPALVLILPAPAALRGVRRLGVWQANVAVEGLYLAVR